MKLGTYEFKIGPELGYAVLGAVVVAVASVVLEVFSGDAVSDVQDWSTVKDMAIAASARSAAVAMRAAAGAVVGFVAKGATSLIALLR